MNCWFCLIRESKVEHVLKLEMYGGVETQNTNELTKVAYNVRHIEVARCPDCHSRHLLAKVVQIVDLVLAGILLIAIFFATFKWIEPLFAGIWIGMSAGLIIGLLVAGYFIQRGIYSIRKSKSEYPDVKELLEKSYKFGVLPKTPLPHNDPPYDQSNDNLENNK